MQCSGNPMTGTSTFDRKFIKVVHTSRHFYRSDHNFDLKKYS